MDEWIIDEPQDPKIVPGPIIFPTPDPPTDPLVPVGVPDFPPIEIAFGGFNIPHYMPGALQTDGGENSRNS